MTDRMLSEQPTECVGMRRHFATDSGPLKPVARHNSTDCPNAALPSKPAMARMGTNLPVRCRNFIKYSPFPDAISLGRVCRPGKVCHSMLRGSMGLAPNLDIEKCNDPRAGEPAPVPRKSPDHRRFGWRGSAPGARSEGHVRACSARHGLCCTNRPEVEDTLLLGRVIPRAGFGGVSRA